MSSLVLINWLTYPSLAPSLIVWALANKILIFGAWAKSHILLQIWIGLSLLIVGVSFACQGFWQVTGLPNHSYLQDHPINSIYELEAYS